jgi:hypothetical protein
MQNSKISLNIVTGIRIFTTHNNLFGLFEFLKYGVDSLSLIKIDKKNWVIPTYERYLILIA